MSSAYKMNIKLKDEYVSNYNNMSRMLWSMQPRNVPLKVWYSVNCCSDRSGSDQKNVILTFETFCTSNKKEKMERRRENKQTGSWEVWVCSINHYHYKWRTSEPFLTTIALFLLSAASLFRAACFQRTDKSWQTDELLMSVQSSLVYQNHHSCYAFAEPTQRPEEPQPLDILWEEQSPPSFIIKVSRIGPQ